MHAAVVDPAHRVDSNTKSISSLLVLMVARDSDTRDRPVYCARLLINDVLPVPVCSRDDVHTRVLLWIRAWWAMQQQAELVGIPLQRKLASAVQKGAHQAQHLGLGWVKPRGKGVVIVKRVAAEEVVRACVVIATSLVVLVRQVQKLVPLRQTIIYLSLYACHYMLVIIYLSYACDCVSPLQNDHIYMRTVSCYGRAAQSPPCTCDPWRLR